MSEKVLMCGNEAVGEGAIQAGCRHYFGYPITPQNELTAYMAKRLGELGGVFIQSESELAAINMVFGASAAGARAMTSSSSPGISLKQEGISYIAGAELPCVIVNIMRASPGLGDITPSQADYFQAVKGGGHGDYKLIVIGPASVQELYDWTARAFYLADKYRNPVMILGDGILGQMMEPLKIRKIRESKLPKKTWALTGAKGRRANKIMTLMLKVGELEEHNKKLQNKYKRIEKEFTEYEAVLTEDAEIILVAYGMCARICKESVFILRKEGIKAGLIRPITLWPYPSAIIRKISNNIKYILTVEMSAGQMVEDVKLAVLGRCHVYFYGRMGGGVPTSEEIIKKVKSLEAQRRKGAKRKE